MDPIEALGVLSVEAKRYLGRTHAELSSLVEEPHHLEVPGPGAVRYQIEVSATWDDKPGGTLRLFFSIDDGGLRAFAPLTRDALVEPGEAFDGELR